MPNRWLIWVAGLALAVRTVNLGRFSLWLDEILETRQAAGTFPQLLEALARDAVHPPLPASLTWLLVQAGAGEPVRRVLPVLFGVATVLLLARWAAERFGRRAGVVTGVVAALSPLHVHYSQELRPYALAILAVVLALYSLDQALGADNRRRVALWGLICWLAVLAALYSLYLAVFVFVPLLVLVLEDALRGEPPRRRRARRLLVWSPLWLLSFAAVYLPWLVAVLTHGQDRLQGERADAWNWQRFGRRLEHFTIGGREGDPASVWLVVPLLLLLAGLVFSLRRRRGGVVLAGLGAGTVGVEILLRLSEHWTNDRYNLLAWPFLVVVLAVAIEGLGRAARRPWGRVVVLGLCALLATLEARGLWRYYTAARPDWRWMAQAVAAVTRPGDRLLVANEWTRVCLNHYLNPYLEKEGAEPLPMHRVDGNVAQAVAASQAEGCTYLVVGGYPRYARLNGWLRSQPLLAADPGRHGGRLYRLSPYGQGRDCVWTLPAELRRRPLWSLMSKGRQSASWRLEMGPGSRPHLLAGWSQAEVGADGHTFTWAEGREALLALGGLPARDHRLVLIVWPFEVPGRRQSLELELNGQAVGGFALDPGRQRLELPLPAAAVRAEENLLRLRFGHAASPREIDPASTDLRPLSVAFESLEVSSARPAPGGDGGR